MKTSVTILLLFLFYQAITLPQNEKWKLYGYDNYINSMVRDGNTVWAGTSCGVAELNLLNNQIKYYTRGDYIELDNAIYSVAIDNNGNKWFGGNSGKLIKYDGINFTVYDSSNSLLWPGDVIMTICPDKVGNLWIGGNGLALYKFDGINWTEYSTTNSGLPYNYVMSIAVDSNNVKWIGTYGGGLARFDDTLWNVYNPGIPYIEKVAVDNSGNIWVAAWGSGLGKFDGVNWTIYTSSNSPLPNNRLLTVMPDASGNIWSGVSDYGGLVRFDGVNWTIFDSTNSNIHIRAISDICTSNSGGITAGTDGGILKSSENDFELLKISETPWVRYNTSLVYDNSRHQLWTGTQYGLMSFNGLSWVKWDTTNSPLLAQERINHLLLDHQNKLWVSTTRGIAVNDGCTWIKYNTLNSGLPYNYVSHIAEDPNGSKWISTAGGGIAVFDGQEWTVYNTNNSPLRSNYIEGIAIQNNIKWIASYGLLMFDGVDWRMYDTSNSALQSDYIKCVAVQSDTVWAGTDYGLTIFTSDSSFTYTKENSMLLDNDISCITVSGNTTFIGSGYNGFNTIQGGTWRQFTHSNSPLNTGTVRTICVDEQDNKWIGSWSGGWGASLASYNTNAVTSSDIVQSTSKPDLFKLYQNYPNPYNPLSKIKFQVLQPCRVILKVYDILGREVSTLLNQVKEEGTHEVEFDGSNLSSGVYFYRLEAGSFFKTMKMTIIK